MVQHFKGDHEVVRRWWSDCKEHIRDNGFTLDNYYPPVKWPSLPGECRSFLDILKTSTIWSWQSARAKSNDDSSLVELTVWQTAPIKARARYFDVNNRGSYTVMATPIDTPPPRRRWLGWLCGL
ncbi:hypothetical protein BJY52DRAFT_1221155 [Lactarius psammicola]|nr:hypothetical protein BJY52DRAFT_1221155 [Lactarius psammicola]